MAYRGTFITAHVKFEFSPEFVEKYKDQYHFCEGKHLPISSKYEMAFMEEEMENDFVKELIDKNYNDVIVGWWCMEDERILKVEFSENGIEQNWIN